MMANASDWFFSQDTQELDAEQIKKLHQEYHAQLEPTRKYYEKAGQWRRYVPPTENNVALIAEALLITEGDKPTPKLIVSTFEKYKEAMLFKPEEYPELSQDPEKERKHKDRFGKVKYKKIKQQKCRNMGAIMCCLLRQTNLETWLVGNESSNGYFYGVSYHSIMRDTKLSYQQVTEGLRTLNMQGCLEVTQRKVAIKNPDGTTSWRQKSNVYKITEFFLNKLGMLQAWKRAAKLKTEGKKSKRQKANAEAQEKASKAAADARLSGNLKPVRSKNNGKTVSIEIAGTGKTIIKNAKDQKEEHEDKENPHRAEFKRLLKSLGG